MSLASWFLEYLPIIDLVLCVVDLYYLFRVVGTFVVVVAALVVRSILYSYGLCVDRLGWFWSWCMGLLMGSILYSDFVFVDRWGGIRFRSCSVNLLVGFIWFTDAARVIP